METTLNATSYLQFRLESFKESPFDTKRVKCTQKKLAEAGFYYTPSDDNPDAVTCYACSVKLQGWNKKTDDPWTKHLEERSDCMYLEKKQSYNNDLNVLDFIEIEKWRYLKMNDELYKKKKDAMDEIINELTNSQKIETLSAKENS